MSLPRQQPVPPVCTSRGALAGRLTWTDEEKQALREAYARGGPEAACRALPHRSARAIKTMACRLGVAAPRPNRRSPADELRRQKVQAALRQLYAGEHPRRGAIKALATRLGVDRIHIYREMQAMDLPPLELKGKPWTDAENELLEETAHLSVAATRRTLRLQGYKRSVYAITKQRSRLELCARTAKDDAGYRTTTAVAELLGTSLHVVRSWIDRHGLRAELRGTAGGAGSHYLIRDEDLRRWIASHPLRVNIARVPTAAHPWFITMLSGLDPK